MLQFFFINSFIALALTANIGILEASPAAAPSSVEPAASHLLPPPAEDKPCKIIDSASLDSMSALTLSPNPADNEDSLPFLKAFREAQADGQLKNLWDFLTTHTAHENMKMVYLKNALLISARKILKNIAFKDFSETFLARYPFYYRDAGKIPISFALYLDRLVKFGNLDEGDLVTAIIFLDRHLQLNPACVFSQESQHSFLAVTVLIAQKLNNDFYFANSHWARIVGLSPITLNCLEINFIENLNFSLEIPREITVLYREALGLDQL